MKVKFTIPGEPKGKARPRFARLPNGATRTYTPKETELYENLIIMAYRQQCKSHRFLDDAMLDMRVIAYYTIPGQSRVGCIEQGRVPR